MMALVLTLGLGAQVMLPVTAVVADTVVTFPDANLEAAIRQAIGKPTGDIHSSELASLTSLSASGKGIANLTGLEYCTNLNQLDLGSNQISNLMPLASLANLTSLGLGGNQISDISPLASLTNLTNLDLSLNQISNLSPLASLTNLTGINLGVNQISNISPLASLTNLTSLEFGQNQISNLTPLAGLTHLTSLGLGYNQISNLSPLAGLTSLNNLSLSNNQISNLSPLAGLTNLTQLYLSSNQISDLTPLAGLTNLTNLQLTSNKISNLTPLAGLTSLINLDLSGNQISDLAPLAGLASLKVLDLDNNWISDLAPLAGLTNLKEIYLRYSPISNLAPLAGLTNLTILVIVGTHQISDLAPLVGLTNLTNLDLVGNQISNLTPLAGLTNLTWLALAQNQISDLTPLTGLINLTYLTLVNNQISDIVPLVNNPGLATGDTVDLRINPLSTTTINIHIPALQARGVTALFTRAAADATLSNLAVSQGTITPTFAPTTTSYSDNVSNSVTSITVTPMVNESHAIVKVNSQAVTSGSSSQPISLSVGDNPIVVKVTAQDGITTDTYTVTVTRQLSADATLNNLVVSQGTLTPAFAPTTTSYSDNVSNSVTSITVTPIVNESHAIVKVNSQAVTSGSSSQPISLSVGDNPIAVKVTAQDGITTDTYTVTVAKQQDQTPVVTFPDANLEAAIRQAIGKPTGDIHSSELASLTSLSASGKGIANLTGLEYCTNLQWLGMGSNQISNLLPLVGLTSLTQLDLGYNQISNLTPLAGLTSLTHLDLYNNQISDLAPMAGLTNLTGLYLSSNQISNLTPLAGLTSLTQLDLNNNQISNLTPLAGLTSLNGLYLYYNQISNLAPLAGLTSLIQLELYNNQISDLAPLAGLTNLNELYLGYNQIIDLSPLVNNTGLATGDILWVGGNPLSWTSAKVQIPALQARGVIVEWDGYFVVTFPDANLEAAIREALNKPVGDINSLDLASLTHLGASNRGIANLTGLEYCTSLNQLYLQNNHISDIAPLVNNSGLTMGDTVWLSGNPLSQNSITIHIPALRARGVIVVWDDPVVVTFPDANLEAAIRQALNKPTGDIHSSELASLTSLSASSKGIANLTGLEYCTNLNQLNLGSNQIINLSPLAELNHLTVLDLGSNQIINLTPLAGLTSLNNLNLDNNQINDLGPLASRTSLHWLHLNSNQIIDIKPLAYLTNLSELYLGYNQISDIKPLVDNLGLEKGDTVWLSGDPLSQTSISLHIPALQARGVTVLWGTQSPPTLIQPETTQWHTLNTPAIGNEILSPSEVNKIAVAADGFNFWAVDTPAKAIRKSSHMGLAWSDTPNSALHSAMTAAGIPQDNQFIWDVVIAPDNSEMVAVVTGSATSPDPTEVWTSTTGGYAWDCTDFSAISGGAIIGSIDISVDYGTGRDIAVGVRDGVPGAFRLWVLQTSGSNPWKLQTMVPAANADILALKFSPGYKADASLATIYCTDNATYYNIALRDLNINATLNWVYVFPGIEVKSQDSPIGASPEATTIVNADLELPSDFNARDANLRRAYISTDSLGAGTKSTTARDGIFRIDDTTVCTLMDTSQITTKSICSIAYSGTYASGKLLAGEVLGQPCTATVPTWFTDSPTECPVPCWYPALKPATGAAAQGTCTPGPGSKNGFGNAQVAWSPDGTLAYCGTGSADFRNGGVNTSLGSGCWPAALRTSVALDESAFSLSRNNAETWNQIGLINTRIDKLADMAPSADSSTIYLASSNNADVNGGGCTGFDSVWRSSSNADVVSPFPPQPVGTFWERVFTHNTSLSCTDNQTNQALLRVVPYDADPTGGIIAWGVYDPQSTFKHGVAAWSPDYGDYWAMLTPRNPVQDFCFGSTTMLYFLSPSGTVQKMPYTGTAWATTLPDVNTGLGSGYSIAAMPDGHVLVGGGTSSNYPVAYSDNASESFTAITKPLNSGTVLVAFDTNFTSNGIIYAATNEANSGGTIYRNTLPTPGQWTNLKPLQIGYCGLVTGPHWALYAANPLFVERTLYPGVDIPGDRGEWDVLISELSDFSVRIGLQPNSLKLSGRPNQAVNQAVTLYFIDNKAYDPGANAGRLWMYTDCQEVAGPELTVPTTVECNAASGKPSQITLDWNRGCWEKFYELQIASTDNFTTGLWKHLWYQPHDASNPSFLIPPGGTSGTSENATSWVGTLSNSVSNILGLSPNMQAIGLEPTISEPSLQPECGHTYYWRVRDVGSIQGDIIRSPWSATESFTIVKAPPRIVSVPSATGTGVVTFSSDIGTITDLTAIAEGTLPTVGKPAGIAFPHGLFAFKITGIDPGATATVTITFPSSLPGVTQYWKYQASNGWYQIPIVSHVHNVIVIRLTDGGIGDADRVANGIIVDPGGPAVPKGAIPPPFGPPEPPVPTQLSPRRPSPPLPQPLRLPPADMSLRNIAVNPGETYAGQPVTVLANVVNNGGSSGSYDVVVRINGRVEQQRMIEVSPGTAYPVKFTVTKSQPGTYTVNIGDKKGSFIILGAGNKPSRDVREGPVLVAAMVVIVLLFCLVILIARRRLQGY